MTNPVCVIARAGGIASVEGLATADRCASSSVVLALIVPSRALAGITLAHCGSGGGTRHAKEPSRSVSTRAGPARYRNPARHGGTRFNGHASLGTRHAKSHARNGCVQGATGEARNGGHPGRIEGDAAETRRHSPEAQRTDQVLGG